MKIGCLGDVAFEVSSEVVKTIQSFSWTSSASLSEHKVLGYIARTENTGITPDKASLKMTISEYLGAKPMKEYETLRGYARAGSVISLVIGEKSFGYSWVITSVTLTARRFDKKGNISSIDVSVSLKEYC